MPTEAETAVAVIDKSLTAADKAIDLYNKGLDQLIPWKTFEETVNNLAEYQDHYSKAAGAMVGKVKSLLMDSEDAYFKSTQSIYEWSSMAASLLSAYLELFEQFDAEKAAAQKHILLKVLGEGITKMGVAQDALQTASQHFNAAAGELITLNTQLSNDFDAKSSYFQAQVDKIRKEAYGGAAAGAIAGPFGLIISYSIAAGVVEGKLIPELQKQLKSVQGFFTDITALVKTADQQISDAKSKLKEEVQVIGDMKASTETTQFFVEYDDLMLKQLKGAASKLIQQCQDYMHRHGKARSPASQAA
ncbi:hemolysin E [Aestuariibacter halophilus]|uniref:Hemolysin E n=1 Tax=Fluctibacter halophilus TaxID=226011 RepID=A0ABS8G3Y2_9ALTE|nr:hemolysin E [Aestuariibacter halophilus]MCC2615188.1 hemolysin E [Aestuariibacter halophilus]